MVNEIIVVRRLEKNSKNAGSIYELGCHLVVKTSRRHIMAIEKWVR